MFRDKFLLRPLVVFLFWSIILLFTGCNNDGISGLPSPPTDEQDNFNYSVTVDDTPEIRVAGSAFEISTNNCGNPVSTIETFSKSREFNTSVEFGLTEAIIGEVGGGIAKVAEAKLGAQVEAGLKIGIGSVEKVQASRQVETPPDSKTTIKLQWEEVWAKGNISVRRTDNTIIGNNIPFFALTTMSLTQKEVNTIKCGTVVPTLPAPLPQPSTPVVIEQATVKPQQNTSLCTTATPLPHRQPVVGEPWILPSNGWVHLNFWSNEPGIDQTEHKILLGPDDPRVFLGGGSAWQFPDECESTARANFNLVSLPEISLGELQLQNLVVR